MDGYEQDDKDVVMNEKSNISSNVSAAEIYSMLGCDFLDEE